MAKAVKKEVKAVKEVKTQEEVQAYDVLAVKWDVDMAVAVSETPSIGVFERRVVLQSNLDKLPDEPVEKYAALPIIESALRGLDTDKAQEIRLQLRTDLNLVEGTHVTKNWIIWAFWRLFGV